MNFLTAVVLTITSAASEPPLRGLEKQIRQIAAGKESSRAWVSPAAGVTVLDSGGTTRFCGQAATLFADAVDRTMARLISHGVVCRREGSETYCQVVYPKNPPDLFLIFGGEGSFVLRAVGWRGSIDQRERTLREVRKAGAEHIPCEDTTLPEADEQEAAITTRELKTLLTQLEAHNGSIANLVDAPQGVAVLEYWNGDSEEGNSARLRCGKQAVRALQKGREKIGQAWSCQGNPGPADCSLGLGGEYALLDTWWFQRTRQGLRVEAVAVVNSAYAANDEWSRIARLRAGLLGKSCASPP